MISTLYELNPIITPLHHSAVWAGLTPQQLFELLGDAPSLFWLDSGTSAHGWHFLGIAPARRVDVELIRNLAIQPAIASSGSPDGPPYGGLLIQIDYPLGVPPFESSAAIFGGLRAFSFDCVLAYSSSQRRWFAISTSASIGRLEEFLGDVRNRWLTHANNKMLKQDYTPQFLEAQVQDLHYLCAIMNALNCIEAGDIYQINISKKFTAPWRRSSAELYLRMRQHSPPAHGAYLGPALSPNGRAICCISPELFLRVRGGHVVTRPIKGTRPPGRDALEYAEARRELESSPKERAELNMIVDLERNDLGRVCNYGSVQVNSAGEVEELPAILHRTATISGTLRPGTTVGELLEGTFPGGSITGAPKIRAMQLISQLEREPRGAYCGAIGWLGLNGDLELNIAIRTAVVDTLNGVAHYHAGSGIVADSDPQKECEETTLKALPFFRAVSD